ncbi:MAG: hypothetical protein WKF57_06295 [Nakamurella sp.]
MSTARDDGARRMLEMLSGHADGELFPRADDRVRLIEAAHPDVVFDRHLDGGIIGWGVNPTLATGRIDGDPFAFMVRHNYATLWVWPDEVGGEKLEAPCREVPPTMVSGAALLGMLQPNCDLDDGDAAGVFDALLDELVPADPYGAEDEPPVSCLELWEIVREEVPELELIDLGSGLELSPQLFFRMPSKATVKVSWSPATRDGNLEVRMFPPDSFALSRSHHVLEGHEELDQSALEVAVLDDSGDAALMIAEAMFAAMRRLDPVAPYMSRTIGLEESERERWQLSAVRIQRELARLFTLAPISLPTEKGWVALSTIDPSNVARGGIT